MKKEVTQALSLPDDLIHEILLRLPIKSLLRFKSVHKSWLSLISDPGFAKSHYDLAAGTTHRLLLKCSLGSIDPEVVSIEIETLVDNCYVDMVSNIPLPICGMGCSINIVGSCRGFILLTNSATGIENTDHNDFFDFVIWNPTTGQCIQRQTKHMCIHPQMSGIGYDSSTDDYVVAILQLSLNQDLPLFPTVDYFSLRTNSWSRVEGTVPCYFPGLKNVRHMFMHMFLNGALHWMAESYNDLGVIIAFDVRERSLSDIPLSRYITIGWEYKLHHLTVMQGLLCLCLSDCMDCFSTTEIWAMREYKVQESWTKLFVLSNISYHCLSLFLPIRFTKTGEILGSNGTSILLVNDKGEGREGPQLSLHGQTYFSLTCMYRESLLSLPVEF